MISDAPPIQYHNYLTLMSGTCHLQYRSKLGVLAFSWMYLGWQDQWEENTEVCYRGHCFIDSPPQSAATTLHKNLLKTEGGRKNKTRVVMRSSVGGEGGNLLSDIKWEFQPGCLREEVSKRGCVKVRHVHSKRECQVKLIRVPWPFLLHFHVQQPRSTTGSSTERWETVMLMVLTVLLC